MNPLIADLITIRKRRGISQRQLAKLSGYSRDTITEVESRSRSPRLVTLCEIAEALGYRLTLERVGE